MTCTNKHIPAAIMKRYSVISERSFRGRSSGECALVKDGKVIEWFSKRSAAIRAAKELAKHDMKSLINNKND